MNDDLDESMPDVRRVFEESRPELIQERRRKAVEKLVDAGLIDGSTLPPAPPPQPSTGAPAEERPVTRPVAPAEAAKRPWTQSWKVAIGFLLLAAAMPVLVWVVGRTKEQKGPKETAEASATAVSATATAKEDAVPNATAVPRATAEPAPSAKAAPLGRGTAPSQVRASTPRRPRPSATASQPVADDILP
jgi:hypothetical protein